MSQNGIWGASEQSYKLLQTFATPCDRGIYLTARDTTAQKNDQDVKACQSSVH